MKTAETSRLANFRIDRFFIVQLQQSASRVRRVRCTQVYSQPNDENFKYFEQCVAAPRRYNGLAMIFDSHARAILGTDIRGIRNRAYATVTRCATFRRILPTHRRFRKYFCSGWNRRTDRSLYLEMVHLRLPPPPHFRPLSLSLAEGEVLTIVRRWVPSNFIEKYLGKSRRTKVVLLAQEVSLLP